MQKVVLGKTGLEVSAVGFGGIPIMRVPQDRAVAIIRRALDLGVTFIDTAAGYADSQTKIGLAIKGRRDGLVLATKSGRCEEKCPYDLPIIRTIKKSVEKARKIIADG